MVLSRRDERSRFLIMASISKQLKELRRGVEEILVEDEFKRRLASGRP